MASITGVNIVSVSFAESVKKRFAEEYDVTLGGVDSELVSVVCQAGHLDPCVVVVLDASVRNVSFDRVRILDDIGARIICIVGESKEGFWIADLPFDCGFGASSICAWNLVALVILEFHGCRSIGPSAFTLLCGTVAIRVAHGSEGAGSLSHSDVWMILKINYKSITNSRI